MSRAAGFRRMGDSDLVCFKRLYDHPYLVCDAPNWRQQLNCEGRHGRGLEHLRFSEWHELEDFFLSYCYEDRLNAPVLESWRS